MRAIILTFGLAFANAIAQGPINPPVEYPIAIGKGGTGRAFTDPAADTVWGWDNTGNQVIQWTFDSTIERTGTVIGVGDLSVNNFNNGSGASASTYLKGNGTWGTPPSTPLTYIVKTTDESRASSATITADSTLVVPILANADCVINFEVWFSTGATPDFKYAISGPASQVSYVITGWTLAGGGAAAFQSLTSNSAYGTEYALTGAGGPGYARLAVLVDNGANAGNVTFGWAQNTSSVVATTVKAGSFASYVCN